jgi:hypothetical protein
MMPNTMTTRRKVIVAAAGTLVVVFLTPIAWSAWGAHGYFDGGRCTCGNPIFIRIRDDGYFRYSPGHGVPEHRAFALRRRDGGWDVLGLRPPDGVWSPVAEGEAVARMRLQDGALYESWDSTTNWTRRARVYNVWRVWIPEFLSQ